MPTAAELLKRNDNLSVYDPEWLWAESVRNGDLSLPTKRKAFLVQGIEEDPAEFAKRADLCEYAALTPGLDRRVCGAVWKRPPARTMPEAIKPFAAKVTPDGMDVGEFTKRVVLEALWGRFAVVLIDRPELPAGAKPRNAAEDRALGVDKPYAVMYGPRQVLDYRAARDGRLEYVKLLGPVYTVGADTVTEVREISLAGIQTWKIAKSGKGQETVSGGDTIPLAEGLTAAKQLPVAVCRFDPIDALRARSPFAEALRAELRALRLLSDILWDLWIAGHPVMLCAVRDQLAQLGIGINKFIKLNPGDAGASAETIQWLEAQLPGLVQQIASYEAARNDIWQQAGIKPQTPKAGTDVKSGTAIATEFEQTEANTLSAIADMAADFEFDLLSIAALDMGASSAETLANDISVAYPKDFSLQSPERLMMIAQTIKGLKGPDSPATIEAVRRAILASLDGMDEETRKAVEADLEAGAYVPPALDFGGGPPEPPAPNPPKKSGPVPAGPGGK